MVFLYSDHVRGSSLTNSAEYPDPTSYDSIDKSIFIRALAEARMRNPGTALAKYIESFITVQVSGLV